MVGALLFLSLVGCSLLTPIPDLTGGTPPEDAGLVDGTAGPDASVCAHAFCDDFDHGDLASHWILPSDTIGVLPRLDGTLAESAPTSLLARIPREVTAGCAYARLHKHIDGSFMHIRAGAAFRAGGPAELGEEVVFTQYVSRSGADRCALLTRLTWSGTSYTLAFLEQVDSAGAPQQNSTHDNVARIPPDTWQSLDIETDYAAGLLRVKDGSGEVIALEPLRTACPHAPGALDVWPGLHCSTPSTAMDRSVHIDDVFIDPR